MDGSIDLKKKKAFILLKLKCSPQTIFTGCFKPVCAVYLSQKEIPVWDRVVNVGLKTKHALIPKGNCSR